MKNISSSLINDEKDDEFIQYLSSQLPPSSSKEEKKKGDSLLLLPKPLSNPDKLRKEASVCHQHINYDSYHLFNSSSLSMNDNLSNSTRRRRRRRDMEISEKKKDMNEGIFISNKNQKGGGWMLKEDVKNKPGFYIEIHFSDLI